MRPGADQGLSEHGRPNAASLDTSKCPPTSPYPSPLFWPLGSFRHQWSPSSWKSPLSLSAWFCANSSGPSLSYGSSPMCFLKDFSCSPFSALRAIPAAPLILVYSVNKYLGTQCVPGCQRRPDTSMTFSWGRPRVRKKTCGSGKLRPPKSKLFPQFSPRGGSGTESQDPRAPASLSSETLSETCSLCGPQFPHL